MTLPIAASHPTILPESIEPLNTSHKNQIPCAAITTNKPQCVETAYASSIAILLNRPLQLLL